MPKPPVRFNTEKLGGAVLVQAIKDLQSPDPAIAKDAQAFLESEEPVYAESREFWAHAAGYNINSARTRKSIADLIATEIYGRRSKRA